MKIYLAGNPAEHEQCNRYAEELEADGHQVVSTWHRTDAVGRSVVNWWQRNEAMNRMTSSMEHLISTLSRADEGKSPASGILPGYSPEVLERAADRFHAEVESADWVIADLASASGEAGYALALGKRLIAIGSANSMLIPLFGEHIKVVGNWTRARAALTNTGRARAMWEARIGSPTS